MSADRLGADQLIIQVSYKCEDKDGESYAYTASPQMVACGYLMNRAVLVQYPDGRIAQGTKVLVTPLGLEKLKREFPVGKRSTAGNA